MGVPRARLLPLGLTVALVAAGAVSFLSVTGAADSLFLTFRPPHTVKPSAARFDPDLQKRLDGAVGARRAPTVTQAIEIALEETGSRLHFGLKHKTRLDFGPDEREGNCIEYAHFFAAAFDMTARSNGLAARAWTVHSAEARVLGLRVPGRGWGDHDWVLVADETTGGRWYVDPTMADAGFGWDIDPFVEAKETLRIPREGKR
jgi:hypothetical protein